MCFTHNAPGVLRSVFALNHTSDTETDDQTTIHRVGARSFVVFCRFEVKIDEVTEVNTAFDHRTHTHRVDELVEGFILKQVFVDLYVTEVTLLIVKKLIYQPVDSRVCSETHEKLLFVLG